MKTGASKSMAYAIKADIPDPHSAIFDFPEHKTMYGGKAIAVGDEVFVFASETRGGRGLVARGMVIAAAPIPRRPGVARQTPRVAIRVERTALTQRPLGRAQLNTFVNWADGRPETELNFKFYRQATDKIVGLSDSASAFLRSFF